MKVSPWLWVSVALTIVILVQYRCTKQQGKSAADAKEAELLKKYHTADSLYLIDKKTFGKVTDSLKKEIVARDLAVFSSRGKFEGSGLSVLKHDTIYRDAVVRKDTAAELQACADISLALTNTKSEYFEMQRQRDSLDADNAYLREQQEKHIHEQDADHDSTRATVTGLADNYVDKTAEDKKAMKHKWWQGLFAGTALGAVIVAILALL